MAEEQKTSFSDLERKVEDLDDLMATHNHKGDVSIKIDSDSLNGQISYNDLTDQPTILSESDVNTLIDTAIDANEEISATITASDVVKLENATEESRTGPDNLVYTVSVSFAGTLRIYFDGKKVGSNTGTIKIESFDSVGTQKSTDSTNLTTSYVTYDLDLTVKEGYYFTIELSAGDSTTSYIKNFQVCYDLTKNKGVGFI